MCDGFSFERGKILLDTEDVCAKAFSVGRSKTAEHNIYERTKNYLDRENEKSQKSKGFKEN